VDTLSTGTLKAPSVEIVIGKDFTIHQFEHTELIGHHITFGIDSIAVDISGRTIIAAEEQTIIFDRFHQCPQTNQIRITIEILSSDVITSTNASVDFLFDLCRFFISHKGRSSGHLTGKIYNLFHISERFLIVENVCIRFHNFAVGSIRDDKVHRISYSITQIIFCNVVSVRSNNDLLINYLRKLVSDRIRRILIITTKPNKITLNNPIDARKVIKTSVQNSCNIAFIERVNFLMRMSDLEFNFVEDRFGAHEELIAGRIDAPHNSRSAVDLDGHRSSSHEPIQHGQVAVQDGIFGVFQVGVFHTVSMARNRGVCKGVCASSQTVTHRHFLRGDLE